MFLSHHIVAIVAILASFFLSLNAYFIKNNTIRFRNGVRTNDCKITPPTLPHAKAKAGTVNHQVRYYSNPHAHHPNFVPILSVHFLPPITFRQFKRLKRLYSGGWSPNSQSCVRFNQTKAREKGYDILDFLPPILQATRGHRFQPEDEKGEAPLHYQCWGFLLDVLFLGAATTAQQHGRYRFLSFLWPILPTTTTMPPTKNGRGEYLTIASPDSRSVYESLLSKTTLISKGFNFTNNYAEDDNIQPGDLVLIFHDYSGKFKKNNVWLDHVAMYMDGGLLFEKSGSGASTMFRLVDYATFDKSWASVPGVFRAQVRRPKPRQLRKKKTVSIQVVRDLSLGGDFSLPQVRALVQQRKSADCGYGDGDGTDIDKKHLLRVLPGLETELCG